jgi:hypothetical protein
MDARRGKRDSNPKTTWSMKARFYGLTPRIANAPINRIGPLGLCNIKIRCGSVNAGSITLGVHCGVIAPNGVEYGLGGGDRSYRSSGIAHPYPTSVEPTPGPANTPPGDKDYPVSCPSKSCDQVQNSIQDYHDYATPPAYNATGPNSDTYAHHMLEAAGCKVDPIPVPPVCSGQPGFFPPSQPPPTRTPPGTWGWNYGF